MLKENSEDSIDFSDIPPSYWDARRHLYANGIQISDGSIDITDIKYSCEKFEFDLPVGNVTTSGLYLIGQVSDDILITRIGIRTKEHYLGTQRFDYKFYLGKMMLLQHQRQKRFSNITTIYRRICILETGKQHTLILAVMCMSEPILAISLNFKLR